MLEVDIVVQPGGYMYRSLLVFAFALLLAIAAFVYGIQSKASIISVLNPIDQRLTKPPLQPGQKSALRTKPVSASVATVAVRVAKKPASVPLDRVRITSKFGMRNHPVLKRKSFHGGIDLAASLNDNVKSIADGIVIFAGGRGALGNAVFVSHPRLKVISIYGHLNKLAVRKGAKVTAGELIGFAGTTGRSTGVHLHLTLKDAKTRTNLEPVSFLNKISKVDFGITSKFEAQPSQPPRIARLALASQNLKIGTERMAAIKSRSPGVLVSAESAGATVATLATKPQRTVPAPTGSPNADKFSRITILQAAIADANTEASTLNNLLREGLVARKTYLNATVKVEKLKEQMRSLTPDNEPAFSS